MPNWRSKAAPVVRWGGVVIGLLFAVSGAWSIVASFVPVPRFEITAFILYIYAVIFGLLLAVAELGVWPPVAIHFGFLNSGSGRAWFLFFISTLCLSNGFSGNNKGPSDVLLIVAGVVGIILSIVGLIIRKDSAVVNREPVELPGALKGFGGGGGGGGGARASNTPDTAI